MVFRMILCACLLGALIQAAGAATDFPPNHSNESAILNSSSVNLGPQHLEKPKRIFSRTRYLSQQRLRVPKPKPEPAGTVPVPSPRCSRHMESCSQQSPCCDPCGYCHCRRFNTICQCWKLGNCSKKTKKRPNGSR